ncbi:MAG: thiamine-phosphate kinase [Candidatus Omnitrophica bacterium]|nr:thiamine-phosphate kinase [Candidatus Omnitrophota bacterium]
MRVNQIGEFALIAGLKRHFKLDASVKKGIGDDCAVIDFHAGRYLLLTCDMLLEGVDFRRGEDLRLVGRKALGCSISDIAACGGKPRYALVSLGLPPGFRTRDADRLYKGIAALASQFGVNIVGGDTSRSSRLIIDVSMLGIVEKKRLVLRNGARPGDIIFVSGALGGSIRGKHLTFKPRVSEARFLVEHYKVNAMIDISDGLLQDLDHILTQSRAGACIFKELIPRAPEAKSFREAACMGEDFELLFTMGRREAERLCRNLRYRFFPIGEVTPEKTGLRLLDEKARLLDTRRLKGYRHF